MKYSEKEIFVIGGVSMDNGLNFRNEVWIYNPQNGFTRHQGSSLNTARRSQACTSVINGNKTLIIVAGGVGWSWRALRSIEIYDPIKKLWYYGPDLPHELVWSALSASPGQGGVLAFGGVKPICWFEGLLRLCENDGYSTNTILELQLGANSWTDLNITLQSNRSSHVIIPIQ